MPLPPLEDIKFTNDWPDDSADYIISVIPLQSFTEFASNSLIFDEDTLFEVHIFVRKISEEEPEEIGLIEKEIERIIQQNPTVLLGEGINLVQILDFREESSKDSSVNRWHYIFDVECVYRKFVIT